MEISVFAIKNTNTALFFQVHVGLFDELTLGQALLGLGILIPFAGAAYSVISCHRWLAPGFCYDDEGNRTINLIALSVIGVGATTRVVGWLIAREQSTPDPP